MAASTQVFDRLSTTLKACGVDVNGLEIGDFGEPFGRGLATTLPRSVGDELLRVPLACCLTDRTEDAPEQLRPVYDWLDAKIAGDADPIEGFEGLEAEDLRLCLRIWCEEQQPSSEVMAAWTPILRSGVSLESFAHRWGEERITACGPLSSVASRLATVQEEFRTSSSQLMALARHFPEAIGSVPSHIDFEYLHFLCRSRAYPFRPEGSAAFNAICPIADLANHSYVQDASLEQKKLKFASPAGTDAISVRAVEAVSEGSQILYEYTRAGSDELACNFGFVMAVNPAQQVPLAITFPRVTDEQRQLLSALKLGDYVRPLEGGRASVQMVLRTADPFPNVIIVLMRILLHKGSFSNPQQFLKSVSLETKEMDTPWMPTIMQALQANLKLYPQKPEGSQPEQIIYSSTRDVLKKSMERLLALMKQRDAPSTAAMANASLAAANQVIE